jgi:pilus assembly protein TadC
VTPDRPWPVLALSAALLLWPPGSALVAGRVRALRPDRARATEIEAAAFRLPPVHRRRLLAAAAGVATGLLIGGATGLAAGVVGTLLLERSLSSGESEDERILRTALLRDLPGACDLLAVCLTAGLPVGGALAAVGESLPGPLGPRLLAVAGLYRLGAEPGRAWADVPPELTPLARALVRVGESGASVGPALAALASDTRSSARAAVEAEVRRAGVWVLAPLGLCFLPAFVCLGVVPLVLGIAGDVLG